MPKSDRYPARDVVVTLGDDEIELVPSSAVTAARSQDDFKMQGDVRVAIADKTGRVAITVPSRSRSSALLHKMLDGETRPIKIKSRQGGEVRASAPDVWPVGHPSGDMDEETWRLDANQIEIH